MGSLSITAFISGSCCCPHSATGTRWPYGRGVRCNEELGVGGWSADRRGYDRGTGGRSLRRPAAAQPVRLGLRGIRAMPTSTDIPGPRPTRCRRRGLTEGLTSGPMPARRSRASASIATTTTAVTVATTMGHGVIACRSAPALCRRGTACRARWSRTSCCARGWHDFHDGNVQGDIATVHARRPSGRLFALAIDRCTGEIVSAEPLEPRRFGPFADGPPPRRW